MMRFWIANCMESCFSSKKFLILSIECSTYSGINQDNPGPSTFSSAREAILSSPTNLSRHLQSIRQLKASSGFLKSKVGRLKVERPRRQTRKCSSILVCSSGMKNKGFSNRRGEKRWPCEF